mmetsp:Transcript_23742/g.43430  ORF Transcript_23742/g.43430 Transcript_23742/m.43430 type:complete len:253 (+) Transcript_23742:51-809(+)
MKLAPIFSFFFIARAALPPKSSNQLIAEATTIFVGTVTHLESSIVNDSGEPEESRARGDHTKHEVVEVSIKVSKVDKTNHVDVVYKGSEVAIVYRHILLPVGYVGPQGQTYGLEVGSDVSVFTVDNSRVGPFQRSPALLELVEPNGWENEGTGGRDELVRQITTRKDVGPPPLKLMHSRRHGFALDVPLTLARTVTKDECSWLDEELPKGSIVYLFRGHTYGLIGNTGVAVSKINGAEEFFEVPVDALVPSS